MTMYRIKIDIVENSGLTNTSYGKAHMEKYKEEWELSKVNPVY